MFNNVIRDMKKAHSPDIRRPMAYEINQCMDSERLAFVAPASDNEDFKLQVKKALSVLEMG